MLNQTQYLSLKCQEGEGLKVEFKEKLSHLDREIVAFANATGGEIFIGIDDTGHIKGIKITNTLISQIYDIAQNCDPSIQIEITKYHNEQVICIHVKEGHDKPYKCKDGFFVRIGANAQKLKRNEIIYLMQSSNRYNFDEQIDTRFDYQTDFDLSSFKCYLQKSQIKIEVDPKDILCSLGVAYIKEDKIQFTKSGVLFFAKDPQKFYPEAYVTGVCYQSEDRFSIVDKKEFRGPLINQIEDCLTFLKRHINVAAKFNPNITAAREDIFDYPLIALREAVINAITHRDYSYDGSNIYIHMYPTHIDIENPGGLYHGLRIADLGKRSVRRNRLIADLLHRSKYIERVGSGFDRMRHSLSENNNPPLEISASNFFNIRFMKREENELIKSLTTRQYNVYHLFNTRNTLSKKEISEAMGISEDTTLRELKILMSKKLIRKEGIGKGTIYILQL